VMDRPTIDKTGLPAAIISNWNLGMTQKLPGSIRSAIRRLA